MLIIRTITCFNLIGGSGAFCWINNDSMLCSHCIELYRLNFDREFVKVGLTCGMVFFLVFTMQACLVWRPLKGFSVKYKNTAASDFVPASPAWTYYLSLCHYLKTYLKYINFSTYAVLKFMYSCAEINMLPFSYFFNAVGTRFYTGKNDTNTHVLSKLSKESKESGCHRLPIAFKTLLLCIQSPFSFAIIFK